MANVILFGEPMALLIADTEGPLEDIEHFTRKMSGAEVNVSIGLSRLGHHVEYLTRLGDDPFGHYIKKALVKDHIGTEYITLDPVYRTGIQLKNRVTDGSDPQAPYYRKGSAASHITVSEINQIDLSDVQLVHVTGIPPALSQSAREAAFRLVERAKENHILVTFDPNLRPALWENQQTMCEVINRLASMCDIFLPGVHECEILMGSSNIEKIALYYRNLGVPITIIKDGAKGAYVAKKDSIYHVPGFKVNRIVDTVGAGDGFAVGILSGILENLNLKDCVTRANAIGAIQVMHVSDNEGLPTKIQLQKFLQENL